SFDYAWRWITEGGGVAVDAAAVYRQGRILSIRAERNDLCSARVADAIFRCASTIQQIERYRGCEVLVDFIGASPEKLVHVTEAAQIADMLPGGIEETRQGAVGCRHNTRPRGGREVVVHPLRAVQPELINVLV